MLLALTPPTRRLLVGSLVLGAVGAGAYASSAHAPLAVPTIAIAMTEPVRQQHVTREVVPTGAPASRDVALVFTVGEATYMKLEAAKLPKHGPATLVAIDYLFNAIAPVEAAALSADQRAWLARSVRLDTGCVATVASFAVIARLSGDTGYAENAGDTWTARSVMANGTPMLAAKLVGCEGGRAAVFARDASLAVAVEPFEIQNPTLVAAAEKAVMASPEARTTAKEWAEATTFEGAAPAGTWDDRATTTWSTKVLVHPLTNETLVSVHAANGFSCGGPTVKLWAMFRVNADGSLTKLATRLGDVDAIERFVDLDGDGELEIIGRPYIGGTLVQGADGATLQQLDESYFGCPC